jgi:ribosome-associated protein
LANVTSVGKGDKEGFGHVNEGRRMIPINANFDIAEAELQWSFVRSSGPGGQNVNKVASKAVLRWDAVHSPSLPPEVKDRLRAQQRRRITTAGELIITSQRYRDQERNRQDCIQKLQEMVRLAATAPKPRKPKKISRGAREARLRAKRYRAATKSARRRPTDE